MTTRTPADHDAVRSAVRDRYGAIARQEASSCCGGGCAPASPAAVDAATLGYTEYDLHNVPDGADMGLGCGNPTALAALREGETVLDLGSGAGVDCFIAAGKVGATGRVIGVDMTPEMISAARAHARDRGVGNVEFRLGEIEALPVPDNTVDVILSNCVINLSPDKRRVFEESLRVLAPGGRLAISDIVATADIPDDVRQRIELLTGCIAGAAPVREIESTLRELGFEDVRIEIDERSRAFIRDWAPDVQPDRYVASATITARKPQN